MKTQVKALNQSTLQFELQKILQSKNAELVLQKLVYLCKCYPYGLKMGFLKQQFKDYGLVPINNTKAFIDLFSDNIVKQLGKVEDSVSSTDTPTDINQALQSAQKAQTELKDAQQSFHDNDIKQVYTSPMVYQYTSKPPKLADVKKIINNILTDGVSNSANVNFYFTHLRKLLQQHQYTEHQLEQMNYSIHQSFKQFEKTNIKNYVKTQWVRCAVASATDDDNYISYTQYNQSDNHIYICKAPKKNTDNQYPFNVSNQPQLIRVINTKAVDNELQFVIKTCSQIANDYYKQIKQVALKNGYHVKHY